MKGGNGISSLRDFYKQKNPDNLGESVAVFSYYLKEYLKTPKVEPGHIASCCKEVGIKVPTNFPSKFNNLKRRYGWINVGESAKYIEINTSGENFVVHDLPRKENARKDKTTA